MKSSQRIEHLIETSKQYVYIDLNRWILANEELLKAANEEEDTFGIATAYAFIGETEYMQSRVDSALLYFQKALKLAEDLKDVTLEGKCCNMIGSIYSKKGNESIAIDYFHQSIHCLKQVKKYNALSATYNNMSSIYVNLGLYEKALACNITSNYYDDLETNENGPQTEEELNQLIYHINYALLYEKLHRLEDVTKCIDNIHRCKNPELLRSLSQYIKVAKAKLSFGKQKLSLPEPTNLSDYNEFLAMVTDILSNSLAISYNADLIYDYIDLFDSLIEISADSLAESMLSLLEEMLLECQSNQITLMIYQRRLSFEQKAENYEKMQNLYDDYFQLIQKRHHEMDSINQANLLNHIKIEEETFDQQNKEQEVKLLEHRSSYDSLTGLANRYFLNLYGENLIKEAKKYQKNIGVLVLDVDDFKNHNDILGHLGGDYCLMQVANAIRESMEDTFAARFGGDEFVLLSYDCKEDSILDLANRIKENVTNKQLPWNENSIQCNISLSIGYYIGIPTPDKELNDFIRNADNALYQAKEEGKGKIIPY